MTKLQEIKIDCPQCKESQKTVIWQTLNATISPQDKEKLFKGEVNVFRCVKCGHQAGIDAPLLYHDMDLRYTVQFFPPQYLNDGQFFSNFNADGSMYSASNPNIPIPKALTEYLMKPHLVFNMQELLTYVVFRERLARAKGSEEKK